MNAEDPFQPDVSDEQAQRIAYLISGYIRKKLSSAEDQELDNWVSASMENQQLFEDLTDPAHLEKWIAWMDKLDSGAALQRVRSKIGIPEQKTGVLYKSRRWLYQFAAILMAGAILFVISRNRLRDSKSDGEVAKIQDLAPGGRHAVLEFGDGSNILLDTVKSGAIGGPGQLVTKDSMGIVYSPVIKNGGESKWNRISTPPGGEYRVLLSDGTRVWLNAESSLKYPEQFSDSVRKVELSGEAYFEVSKDSAHPFIVQAGNNQIKVLGTHFDVNAYEENGGTVVTLAEGSVKINQSVLLRPGQQAVINSSGQIQTDPADLKSALAWKDGYFIFNRTSVEQVMQQVAHWYSAKIVYKDNISEHFNATVPRDVPVSKLLHLLEATGRVHFRVEDKTITVMN